jgi:hypothetical protein
MSKWQGEGARGGRHTFCLNDVLPNEAELEDEEADVDEVVPPADGMDCPRIDELVERNRKRDDHVLCTSESLATHETEPPTRTANPFARKWKGKISRL